MCLAWFMLGLPALYSVSPGLLVCSLYSLACPSFDQLAFGTGVGAGAVGSICACGAAIGPGVVLVGTVVGLVAFALVLVMLALAFLFLLVLGNVGHQRWCWWWCLCRFMLVCIDPFIEEPHNRAICRWNDNIQWWASLRMKGADDA